MLIPTFLKIAPWLASAISGLLLALCFAPWDHAVLVWIALLPLLWSLWTLPANAPKWHAPLLGYVSGLFFFTTTFHWLAELAGLFVNPALRGLPLLLAAYLALYPALWAWLMAAPPEKARTPLGTSFKNIGFSITGAAAWVSLDWVRGWCFTGFGWNTPGVALNKNEYLALIQIADLVGVHGITFLIVFLNLSFAQVLRRLARERSIRAIPNIRIELMAVVLLLGATLSYGGRSILRFQRSGIPLHTVSLQPNQPQDILFDPAVEDTVFATLDRLMGLVSSLPQQPKLILWPEAATPRGIFADQANHDFIVKQAVRTPAAILLGSVEPKPGAAPDELAIYNSAILLSHNATSLQSYKKRHLVPFGEFLPFRDFFPKAIRELVPGDLEHGQEANLLKLDNPAIGIGALVCFEDSLARETRSLALAGAQILINLTNDAWFGNSAAAAQHLANAKFRAVETRLPLLRCANTGVTCSIDALGRVEQRIPAFTEGLDTTEVLVPSNPSPTPYTLWGDRWLWICALLALRLAVVRGQKARLRSPGTNNRLESSPKA